MKCFSLIIAMLIISASFFISNLSSADDIYGGIMPEEYLTGRFDFKKHKLFVDLKSIGIPVDRNEQYLRIEAAQSLLKMYRDLLIDHPKAKFWVTSAARGWGSQKAIWEKKWTGKTDVNGERLNVKYKDPLQRAKKILEYSSMPGTSRHHWGTDFDINDLNNSYYNSGNGAVIYKWLKENAKKYGFCQPYTSGRDEGYNEEKWHWSYIPLSMRFFQDWNMLYQNDPARIVLKHGFDGGEQAIKLAPVYMNGISVECKIENKDN